MCTHELYHNDKEALHQLSQFYVVSPWMLLVVMVVKALSGSETTKEPRASSVLCFLKDGLYSFCVFLA